MKYSELAINKNVYIALKKYTTQDDYLELFNQVEAAFSKLIKENNEIYQLTKRTIPGTRQVWEDTVYYVESTESTENTGSTEGTETVAPEQTTESEQTPEPQPTPEPTPEPEPEPVVQKVKIKADANANVRVRNGAGTDFEKVGDAYDGDTFVKLGEETGSDGHVWIKIQYNDSTVGYVRSDFVENITE